MILFKNHCDQSKQIVIYTFKNKITSVCTMLSRQCRNCKICLNISILSSPFCIFLINVSRVMKVPVRPTPALQRKTNFMLRKTSILLIVYEFFIICMQCFFQNDLQLLGQLKSGCEVLICLKWEHFCRQSKFKKNTILHFIFGAYDINFF